MRALTLASSLLAAAASSTPAYAGLPDPAFASSEWMIVPTQPTTRDNVVVRNVFSGCNGARAARVVEIDHASGFIDYYLGDSSDICERYVYDDISDTLIGYLQPRAYTVRFFGCGIPYDPDSPGCDETSIPRLAFVVLDAGRPRQIIPAWSFAGAFATVFLLAGIALLRLKRR